jgi:hypothetical protein
MDWDKLKRPPEWALKKIGGGRLKGMTDIKPQWRIQVMNEVFGVCGIGWDFSIDRLWTEPGSDGQVFAFAQISLRYNDAMESAPIPGIGGSMLITKEREGLHNNDEAFKMAVTDALSSAMKMIGVAEDVYMGNWTGSKYVEREEKPVDINAQMAMFKSLCNDRGMTEDEVNDLENAVCNAKKNPNFQDLVSSVVDNFEKTYKWWVIEK